MVTFADIDTVHQRAVGTASRNFRENRKRFIEGTDYFVLIGDALRDYKQATNFVGRKINELHLITETGYLMLVKSFTDDLAWSVQRELVNHYFRTQSGAKGKAGKATGGRYSQESGVSKIFAKVRKNMDALDALMKGLNRYISQEDAEAYVKVIDSVGITILKLTDSIGRMKYGLMTEPY